MGCASIRSRQEYICPIGTAADNLDCCASYLVHGFRGVGVQPVLVAGTAAQWMCHSMVSTRHATTSHHCSWRWSGDAVAAGGALAIGCTSARANLGNRMDLVGDGEMESHGQPITMSTIGDNAVAGRRNWNCVRREFFDVCSSWFVFGPIDGGFSMDVVESLPATSRVVGVANSLVGQRTFDRARLGTAA